MSFCNGYRCRHEGRECADGRDHKHRRGRLLDKRMRASDQVDSGGDHRRGVDQGGDRRRALHRIGQPDMERELCALAHRAHKEQQGDTCQRVAAHRSTLGLRKNTRIAKEVQRPEDGVNPHDRDAEAKIANPVDDKGLLGGVIGGSALVVVADEQIRAETDRLPEDEQQQEVVGQHQHEHGENEERKI